jgi:tetratricopeptide (TPR) repeat protein
MYGGASPTRRSSESRHNEDTVTDPGRAVFLSYASQDAEAAHQLCDALRGAGVEVWFDQSELRGGDAWDASIRRQIKTCALFIPVISRSTHARDEGYFRLEWKLAVDRSHLMAADRPFLVPVVVDDTPEQDERVPDRFRELQWMRLPGGRDSAAFVERVRRLLSLEPSTPTAPSAPSSALPRLSTDGASTRLMPPTSRSFVPWIVGGLLILGTGYFVADKVLTSKRALPAPQVPANVVPYSVEDRRMTFALLPLQGAADDPTAQKVANATGEVVFKSLDKNHEWVRLAPRDSVERAQRQFSTLRDLARALGVHFLMRGTVARASSGYDTTLFVVDGETEHVLGSGSVPIPVNALVPRWNDEIDEATGLLVYYGLQVEVERARSKPVSALDVRDLAFRAFIDWGNTGMANDPKGAYTGAEDLLNRALALAPDDPLTLRLTAKINLCDCVEAWSTNVAEQQAIGETAVDRYLLTHPAHPGMLFEKASIYELRGRYQDALVILDSLLSHNPQYFEAMMGKATTLLKLGRPKDALAPATDAYNRHKDRSWEAALLAAVNYELTNYAEAARLAQQAAAEMSKTELSNPNSGSVRLTLIAAAAHLHDHAAIKSALADLANAAPGLTSITAVRKWMHPQADLYGYEPLFDGLRLAGLPD